MILIIFNEICDNFFQQEGGSLCCNRGFLFAISEGDACVGVEAQETGSRENSQGVRQGCRGWAAALLPSEVTESCRQLGWPPMGHPVPLEGFPPWPTDLLPSSQMWGCPSGWSVALETPVSRLLVPIFP